jgi:CubicO group peptidase (beta-lactamase class C family)
MAAETPIYLASVTKIYIATLVMLLSQDKLLSLDDPATAAGLNRVPRTLAVCR